MKLKIYLDIVFVINFCINGMVLYLGKRVLHISAGILRLVLGAALSAGLSCLTVVLVARSYRLAALCIYIVASLPLIHMAYQTGTWRQTLRCFLTVQGMLLLLGGSMLMLWKNVFSGSQVLHADTLLLLFLCGLILLGLFKTKVYDWQETGAHMTEISIMYRGNIWKLTGFYDSGNHLRDPVSADAVCILDYDVVKSVIPANVFRGEGEIPDGVRMIPCHSIGRHSILPAVYIDTMLIGTGKKVQSYSHVLCALYQGGLMQDERIQMILHNSFQKQI